MVSLAGESQNFDGNGSYVRIQAGGGAFAVQTAAARPEPTGAAARERQALQPLGTRPADDAEAAVQAERRSATRSRCRT